MFWGPLILVLAPLAIAALLVALPSGQASPSDDDSHLRELREMIVAGRPETENAWPAIEAAHERAIGIASETMSAAAAKSYGYGLWRLDTGDWDDPAHADARAMLERLAPVLDDVDRALRGTYSVATPRRGATLTVDSFFPAGSSRAFNSLVRLSNARMRAAAAAGRWDEVERALDRAVRLGRLCDAPTGVMTMYSASIIGVGAAEAIRLVRERSPDAATIDRLCAIVEADEARGRDLRAICRGERLIWLSGLRASFSDDGLAVPWGLERPTLWERMGNISAYTKPRWSDVERDVTADFAALEAWLVAPALDRAEPPKPDSLARHAADLWPFEADDTGFEFATPMLRMLRAPVMHAAALRVYAFHARHGRWPESLAEAAPDRQFIDPRTGETLRYELEHEGDRATGFQVSTRADDPNAVPGKQRRPILELTEFEQELLAQPPEPPAERVRPGN